MHVGSIATPKKRRFFFLNQEKYEDFLLADGQQTSQPKQVHPTLYENLPIGLLCQIRSSIYQSPQ